LNVSPADHVRGSATAPVTMLVYGDYECSHTRELELSVARLRHVDSDSFRYVFRYFPLRDIHPHAQMADGTPSVFINGERYRGARDTASLRAAIAGATE
jgi:protein-disulfide isomerase